MKNLKLLLGAFCIVLSVSLYAENNVTATPHNLSFDSGNVVHATAASEAAYGGRVCAFCHIPHSANTDAAPLWNRDATTANYTMYDSEYLRRTNYPAPLGDLGTAAGEPGFISRQCLSCHDGTVAVGALYLLHGSLLGDSVVAMEAVTGIVDSSGFLQSGATGHIGIDLSVHHPVGYKYSTDAAITRSFGDGNATTVELKTKAVVDTTDIKLYTYTGANAGDYVECSSCHNPHTTNKKFLRVDSVGNNHAQNVVETCTSCHDKEGWTGSAHQNSLAEYGVADTNLSNKYGTRVVGDLGCVNCHTPHKGAEAVIGQGAKYLLRHVDEETCFEGAASSNDTAACHGNGASTVVDLEDAFNVGPYGHVMVMDPAYDGVHTNLDTLYGVGNTEPDQEAGKGVDFANSMHVECVDCHNPHKTQQGNHVTDTGGAQTDLYPPVPSNTVSSAILGVSGVEVTWPTTNEWGSYNHNDITTLKTSTKEYQICFKCHSYWGLGTATKGIPDANYTLASSGEPITDSAWEFNPYNKSAHPVVMSTTAMKNLAGTTRYVDPLPTTAMLAPWSTATGSYTMYCSDCHGNEAENAPVSPDPKGPHGSTKKFMLKGSWDAVNAVYNQYWPTKPDGVTLYKLSEIGTAGSAGLFCKSCHTLSYAEAHTKSTHLSGGRDLKCVDCHVKIPHGSPVSRLIGYDTFPYPYNDGNMKLRGYKGHSAVSASNANAYSVDTGCDGPACHDDATPQYGPGFYDPSPW